MDFPQLPPELVLVLFQNITPAGLLSLVQASPRCLRALESIGTPALQRLLQKIASENSQHDETVHFHRPVAGLNALTSLVYARSAPYDIALNLYEVTPFFVFRDWYLKIRDGDFEHPLSDNRLLYTTFHLYEGLGEGPAAHVEELKSKMIEHYAPFFDREALAAVNRYWDPACDTAGDAREDFPVKLRWDSSFSDELPVSFGCRIKFRVQGSKKPGYCEILTFDMRACRGVVCFTAKAKSDLAHRYREYMTLKDVKNFSTKLRGLGVRPGAAADNVDLIVEEIGHNFQMIKETLGELGIWED
ncbi:hypothetical protein PG999_003694 [Apiospora kogelbergensis]|uniref:F-box domain-containing protein n=1 Tax=Apiospora kogelbergensis TaxID=1337665 RepID=A0AAW0R4I4_9PEZI